jgi:hypothetical protein
MARDEVDCGIKGSSYTITACRLSTMKVCREVITMGL